MSLLERRLENVVHRLGFALSPAQWQVVRHGHALVNGRRVDIPSYLVRAGDVVSVKAKPKILEMIQGHLAENKHDVPDFLQRTDGPQPEGHVLRLPGVEDGVDPRPGPVDLELLSR